MILPRWMLLAAVCAWPGLLPAEEADPTDTEPKVVYPYDREVTLRYRDAKYVAVIQSDQNGKIILQEMIRGNYKDEEFRKILDRVEKSPEKLTTPYLLCHFVVKNPKKERSDPFTWSRCYLIHDEVYIMDAETRGWIRWRKLFAPAP